MTDTGIATIASKLEDALHAVPESSESVERDQLQYVEWKSRFGENDSCTDNHKASETALSAVVEVSTNVEQYIPLPKNIRTLPVARSSINYRLLQLWEGIVESVADESFTAIISDRTNSNLPDELAEFSLEEINSDDKNLVEPGAPFIWSIAYAISRSGRKRVSEIRFRRLMPPWTAESIRALDKKNLWIDNLLGQ